MKDIYFVLMLVALTMLLSCYIIYPHHELLEAKIIIGILSSASLIIIVLVSIWMREERRKS